MRKLSKCYQDAVDKGKAARLKCELAYAQHHTPFDVKKPPLYSHNATRQSYFDKGWHGVTQLQVFMHINPASAHHLPHTKGAI